MTPQTKEILLQAAEKLFLARGPQETTLRDITHEAGVNLAAVNYHFGSKEELIFEVFKRRLTPLHERRLELIRRLRKKGGKNAVSGKVALRVLVRPVVEIAAEAGPAFARIMARLHLEHPETFRAVMLAPATSTSAETFLGALRTGFPSVDDDLLMRWADLVLGAITYGVSGGVVRDLPLPATDAEITHVTGEIVDFLDSGLRSRARKRHRRSSRPPIRLEQRTQ
ncbi:MAG TPA: TetR/AcrR family transcriptional regulator [Thermoanaerobaculia bacterium]|nr:TetR/AcrR family transcriptional regulator [Thermoanaerobaculia bacterium]